MTANVASNAVLAQLLQTRNGLIFHQALYSAAKLGVADCLEKGVCTVLGLAHELKVDESASYRLLRTLASQGVFVETAPRTFANAEFSRALRTDEPASIRPALLYFGSDFYYRSFGEMLHSIETGNPARAKLFGASEWEHMKQNPELARIFDEQ